METGTPSSEGKKKTVSSLLLGQSSSLKTKIFFCQGLFLPLSLLSVVAAGVQWPSREKEREKKRCCRDFGLLKSYYVALDRLCCCFVLAKVFYLLR
jgi:hypothetical protein